jgi:CheY-like chemotaxis protein
MAETNCKPAITSILASGKWFRRVTPLALSTAAIAARRPLQLKARNGARPKLLLAEDSDPVRIVTAAMLKSMGCEVEAVVHGEQALSQAAERSFDVIVLDIEMPVMDGITAAKSIRRLGGPASGTPLMALSAFLADSVRTGEWRDTFDIALPKPTNKNELHDAISAALSWQKNREGGEPIPPLPPVIDAAELVVMRTGLADSIWQELCELGCRDIEVCARQVEHAAKATLDDAVLTFAGKLRSLGSTFAAPRLALLAQRVQIESEPAARSIAIAELIDGARDTVAVLRP